MQSTISFLSKNNEYTLQVPKSKKILGHPLIIRKSRINYALFENNEKCLSSKKYSPRNK